MNKRILGRSGLEVSEIGLGCWAIGGPSFSEQGTPNGWAGIDDNESLRGLHKAYELGINHWDTADTYGLGHSERLLGKALKDGISRDKLIIASKVGWHRGTAANAFEPGHIREQLEQTLTNLGVDYIDLYYFHNPYFGENDMYLEAATEMMYRLKEQGKFRVLGQSAYSYADFLRVWQVNKAEVLQLPYNAMRSPFDAESDNIFRLADENDLGVVMFGTYAKGLLLGKYDPKNPPQFEPGDIRGNVADFNQSFLEKLEPALNKLRERFGNDSQQLARVANQYAISRSKNAVPIPGFKNARQVESNANTGGQPLNKEEVQFVTEVFASFK
jgi:myo-inositol catabolism protein IolS